MINLFHSEAILAEIGINSNTVKLMKQGLKRTSYRAVINWLTKYNPNADASNLEKVNGLLEAFFHLCEVEDVDSALKIIFCHLNTPTQESLHQQLRTWGYYEKLIDLYSHFLTQNLDDNKSAIIRDYLGVIYSSMGDYNRAIDYHEKSLKEAIHLLSYSQVGDMYCNMSFCYLKLENFNKAIEYADKSLEIAKSNQDERLQSKSLYYLAIAYFHLGEDANKTISYIKQAISIAERIQADFLIARMIGDLGNVYSQVGMYKAAYKMYQKRLNLAISRQDKPGEAIALCNLGELSRKREEWDKGIEYLEKAIHISKEIKDKETEGQSYYYLGLIFEKIDDKARAVAVCKQAHDIAQVLPIPLAQECQELMKRLITDD